jgi:hypothetical protein
MPTLTFEGETHGEIVIKVTRWLASLEETHRFVVLVSDALSGSGRTTAWTRFCVCQADFVLLLGDGDGAAGLLSARVQLLGVAA